MNKYLQLFRIGNCIMGIVGLIMGLWVAAGYHLIDRPVAVIFSAGVVFFFIAAGNSLNDYIDREVDKQGHPERPIPSGMMRPETVLQVSAVCFIVSVALSLFLNWQSIVVVVTAVALMLLYELSTKKRGFSGNLTIAALTAMLFLLGGTIVDALSRTYILALLAGLATLGREVIKDIEDMEADFDRYTLPKRIGTKWAGVVGAVAIIGAVSLSPVPYLTGTFGPLYLVPVIVADGIFIYASVVQFRSPRLGQKFAKYGMLVALIAFLLGGLQ
ncbi:MAG: Digeranylgeranylglyceryl phosphate synthase [Methanomassiliicoccales archaeon PtaU1.Bin124]|nr:MAG: Digeranylgeranylglyceryl phosphate synthase [Methanomassiliicoccales archaeon PtaU1.Bin124]